MAVMPLSCSAPGAEAQVLRPVTLDTWICKRQPPKYRLKILASLLFGIGVFFRAKYFTRKLSMLPNRVSIPIAITFLRHISPLIHIHVFDRRMYIYLLPPALLTTSQNFGSQPAIPVTLKLRYAVANLDRPTQMPNPMLAYI